MKNVNKFQIAKIQPRVFLCIYLVFFCQFQPGVAYKSVAYKKKPVCVQIFGFPFKNPRNVSTKERSGKGTIPLWKQFQRLLNFAQIRYFLSVNNYELGNRNY